jgi:hypothetical protein
MANALFCFPCLCLSSTRELLVSTVDLLSIQVLRAQFVFCAVEIQDQLSTLLDRRFGLLSALRLFPIVHFREGTRKQVSGPRGTLFSTTIILSYHTLPPLQMFIMHPPRLPSRLMVLLIFVSNAAAAGSTITVTTTSPATPTSSSYTSDSDFESAMLTAHNFYRGEHNVSNLSWNDTSATYASNWAKACVFQHSVSLFCFYLTYTAVTPS